MSLCTSSRIAVSVSNRIESYRIALYRIASYRIVSHRIVTHRIVPLSVAVPWGSKATRNATLVLQGREARTYTYAVCFEHRQRSTRSCQRFPNTYVLGCTCAGAHSPSPGGLQDKKTDN